MCILCKHNYSYVGNTTNLWQHLEESHTQEIYQAKKETKEAANESKLSSDRGSVCESSNN